MIKKLCAYQDCIYENTDGCRIKGLGVFVVYCEKYTPSFKKMIDRIKTYKLRLKGRINSDNRNILKVVIDALK